MQSPPWGAPPGGFLIWVLIVACWIGYIPASYLAYLWAKAPVRRARDGEALRLLDTPGDGGRTSAVLARAAASYIDLLHDFRSFAWPVTVATTVPFVTLLL